MQRAEPDRIWTVAESKARLSEILRLAERKGPQYIGKQRPFVVVPAEVWEAKTSPPKPMGQWLVDNLPRGIDLEIPSRQEPESEIPFHTRQGE